MTLGKPKHTVVVLKSDLGKINNKGTWITLSKVIKIGNVVIIASEGEPRTKWRPCQIVKQTGFRHKIIPFDKRHTRGNLKKGAKLIVFFEEKTGL